LVGVLVIVGTVDSFKDGILVEDGCAVSVGPELGINVTVGSPVVCKGWLGSTVGNSVKVDIPLGTGVVDGFGVFEGLLLLPIAVGSAVRVGFDVIVGLELKEGRKD